MSSTKQDLLSLKEENLKLNENFQKFWKKHKLNKKYISKDKIKELMEEQEMLINNVNLQIDNIIVKNENRYEKIVRMLPQKRKMSEILPNFENEYKPPKRPHMEPEIVKNSFENVIKNPGLQHLVETIFSYLNYNDLQSCQCINRSSKSILANPKFWLQKFVQRGMSKQNQNDWIKAIKLTKDTDFERNLQLYLKRSLCQRTMIDIQCFIDENTMQKSSKLLKKSGSFKSIIKKYENDYVYDNSEFKDFTPDCFQALSALQGVNMLLFMRFLSEINNLSMIKVVTPLLSSPNITGPFGAPFIEAAVCGNLEIVKFFVSIQSILNNLTVDLLQDTIEQAEIFDQDDVVEYLRSKQ